MIVFLQTVETTQEIAVNLGTKTIVLPEGVASSINRLRNRIESILDWAIPREYRKGIILHAGKTIWINCWRHQAKYTRSNIMPSYLSKGKRICD